MRKILTGIVFFGMVLFFSGAPSSANEGQSALPGRVPLYQYEIPAKLNAKERRWFKVFQEGNIISKGWQDISTEVLAKTPLEQHAKQRQALEDLGEKIGVEWSRANRIRKVDSSMLKEWGDILRTTARKKPHQLVKAIAFIDQEVNAALSSSSF